MPSREFWTVEVYKQDRWMPWLEWVSRANAECEKEYIEDEGLEDKVRIVRAK